MNSEKTEKKRHDELQAVTRMIEIYCRGKHGHNTALCKDCQKLMDYARSRIVHLWKVKVFAVIVWFTVILLI